LLSKYNAIGSEFDPYEVEQEARSFLNNLPRAEGIGAELSKFEWQEVYELRDRIDGYTHWKSHTEFSPAVPGCGVVDRSVADVIAGDELVEIKAVSRRFRSIDFRQVLTYSAMFYAAERKFTTVTILNPRGSYLISVSLDQLASSASGKSAVELLQELVGWMTGLQVSA
jgi:hypothetical protein